MDKYTKMKAELENQKKYNLQLSTSLHKQQKKKNRVMSSLYKANPNMINNNILSSAYLYRITHFSHYFPRSKITKKIKPGFEEESKNNNYQKIKEEFDEYKKNYEKNENYFLSEINELKKKNDELIKEKEKLEENAKEIILNKNKEIEKEKQNKHRLLFEEKEKNKKEIDKLNNEINLLKDENSKIKLENDNYKNINKLFDDLKEKEKNNEKIISDLKLENERLLKQTTLKFKLVKEENDELIKDINKLNDALNKMKLKEKDFIEKEKQYIEKENQLILKQKQYEEQKQNDLNLNKKYNNNNLKVIRIFSNKFIYKNNKITEMILKLKESEKKYTQLKKEKENIENIAQNNQDNTLLIKAKYEKDINTLKEKNLILNNQIKSLNQKKKSNEVSNNEIKNIVMELSEHFNKILIRTQSKYDNKIISMKQKLVKMKNTLMKYIKTKNSLNNNNVIITELKDELSQMEKEKQKMKVKISNYDINFKKLNNEITLLKTELSEANKTLNKLNSEARFNYNDKYELDNMNKKLKKQLEMYIIENNGKSKVIEERNNEITKLKELLNNKHELN